jgi:hypothetical protein
MLNALLALPFTPRLRAPSKLKSLESDTLIASGPGPGMDSAKLCPIAGPAQSQTRTPRVEPVRPIPSARLHGGSPQGGQGRTLLRTCNATRYW